MLLRAKPGLPPPAALQATRWQLDLLAQGTSMEPLVRSGDRVTIQCVPAAEIRTGDVVCFQRDGDYVLHRVLDASMGRFFFEKGDAEAGGQWIDQSNVIGRLVGINGRPLGGSFARAATGVSRFEQNILRWLRRLGMTMPPSVLGRLWRKAKTGYLATHDAGKTDASR